MWCLPRSRGKTFRVWRDERTKEKDTRSKEKIRKQLTSCQQPISYPHQSPVHPSSLPAHGDASRPDRLHYLPTDSECNFRGCCNVVSCSARIVGAKNIHSSSGYAVRSMTFEGQSEFGRSWMSACAGLAKKCQMRDRTRTTSQYRVGLSIVYQLRCCRPAFLS